MVNLKELHEQIAKVDALLQEAYSLWDKQDIILLAGLMAKLQARKNEAEAISKPEPVQAWKHTNELESALEARILSRDEKSLIDF